jgi:parallel beta-helix repeat protein
MDNLSRNNGKVGICVQDVADEKIEKNMVIDNQNDQ